LQRLYSNYFFDYPVGHYEEHMDEIKSLISRFDPVVLRIFRDMTSSMLMQYRSNKTNLKAKAIILNMPLGAFIKSEDLQLDDRVSLTDLCGRINENFLSSLSAGRVREKTG
jgi:hypothetical protein